MTACDVLKVGKMQLLLMSKANFNVILKVVKYLCYIYEFMVKRKAFNLNELPYIFFFNIN